MEGGGGKKRKGRGKRREKSGFAQDPYLLPFSFSQESGQACAGVAARGRIKEKRGGEREERRKEEGGKRGKRGAISSPSSPPFSFATR